MKKFYLDNIGRVILDDQKLFVAVNGAMAPTYDTYGFNQNFGCNDGCPYHNPECENIVCSCAGG
jgi:hypothetical protein